MKNREFWSRETDRKILIATGFLLISGFVGSLPVWPELSNNPLLFGTGIATALLMLTWGLFNLVRPIRARWDRRWSRAEAIVVPIAWILLVVGYVACVNVVYVHERKKLENLRLIISESEYFGTLARTK